LPHLSEHSSPEDTMAFRPIKVLDIELSHPLEDIHGLDAYEAVQALVRLWGDHRLYR
jgi:hypothetical protein